MQNVILVIHILACIALTAVVLLQRSEGGALGIGGGGGAGGGLMSGRGAAGALVRTTMIAAGIFFITSLTLTTIATSDGVGQTDVDRALQGEDTTEGQGGDILDPTVPLLEEPVINEAPVAVDSDPLFETPIEEPAPAGEAPASQDGAPEGEAPGQPQ